MAPPTTTATMMIVNLTPLVAAGRRAVTKTMVLPRAMGTGTERIVKQEEEKKGRKREIFVVVVA
jgi:hypothetical protein